MRARLSPFFFRYNDERHHRDKEKNHQHGGDRPIMHLGGPHVHKVHEKKQSHAQKRDSKQNLAPLKSTFHFLLILILGPENIWSTQRQSWAVETVGPMYAM